MRILAIQPLLRGELLNPAAGGKNRAALVLARRLSAEGHEVYLLPWKGERYADEVWVKLGPKGEQATALPTMRLPEWVGVGRIARRFAVDRELPLRPDRRLRVAVKEELVGRRHSLEAAVRRARPELIHVHESHADVGRVYRHLGGRQPIVLTHHSPGVAEGCPEYDHVVFVSRRQRELALARWPELADRSSVIYYFAAGEFFRPHRPRPSESVVFVGNLDSERKGLGALSEAWASRSELNGLQLRVIGEGRCRKRYQEEARQRGANLAFLGRLPSDAIAEIHSSSAAFVMPSQGEGLALAYIEAVCMGLPILGFGPNVAELSELLGISCGLAHDPARDSADKLAERVLRLVDPLGEFTIDRRIELQRRARRRFAQERFESDYLGLYRRLVAGSGRPAG